MFVGWRCSCGAQLERAAKGTHARSAIAATAAKPNAVGAHGVVDRRALRPLSRRSRRQKLRFRPQLFWQEVLPEQAASADLEFHCDMSTSKNFAKVPSDKTIPSNGGYALSVAKAVDDGDGAVPVNGASSLERCAKRPPLPTTMRRCPPPALVVYCIRAALNPALVE